ncbi:PREDICTED: protein PAT1 homolog 1-like [Priapulus caudatus]|uniref:Protein PAT1 homolog 1-like n=1 Tax=Priapulus caudatus TaxID=37621 RepID=A0ABM1EM53_PRICU|nr:PREDICTED: protein PAT1 homolog 1-like [Priapulus caudatus]
MTESFFSFASDLPPAGDHVDLELNGGYEEEIDQLNDETFGAEVDEAEWDHDDHKKLAELTEHEKSNEGDIIGLPKKVSRTEEEELEQNISQIVEDDQDGLDDPAILNVSGSIPIPKKVQQNLEQIFNCPTSPQGLLDAEQLVSPGRANIWGSPARDARVVCGGGGGGSRSLEDNPLRAVLTRLQTTGKPSSSFGGQSAPAPFNDPSVITVGGPVSQPPQQPYPPAPPHLTHALPPTYAKTVQELESELLQRSGMRGGKTVEELEREMMAHPGGDVVHCHRGMQNVGSSRMPMMGPPPGLPLTPQMAGVMPRRRGVSPPLGLGMNPNTPHIVSLGAIPPTTLQSLSNRLPYTPVGSQFSAPAGRTSPHEVFMSGGRGMPMPGAGRMSPPGMLPFPGISPHGQPRIPVPLPYSDPTHLRRMPPGNYNQGPGMCHPSVNRGFPPGRGYAPNRVAFNQFQLDRNFNRQGQYGHNRRWAGDRDDHWERDNGFGDQEDEYACLMTQREKDWIVKIQMMQLHTNNPYLDDFYYMNYSIKEELKRKAKQKGASGVSKDDAKLIMPIVLHTENRSYRPAQFEGSLGKVSVSSVNNPRQMIDIGLNSEEAGKAEVGAGYENSKQEFRRSRQLLIDIEKTYTVLLEIDDIEKQVPNMPEAVSELMHERRQEKIERAYKQLHIEGSNLDYLTQVMCVRKGKRLVGRVLSLLHHAEACSVLLAVVRNLPLIAKRDQQDEVLIELLDSTLQAISQFSFEMLVELSKVLMGTDAQEKSPLIAAIHTKFGASLLAASFTRAEELYTNNSLGVDSSRAQDDWSQFVLKLVVVVESVSELSTAKPLSACDTLTQHLQRVGIDSKHGDRLASWLQVAPSITPEE